MRGERSVEAEWLDLLPASDPRAVRSRRDLRRVNACMLQAGIMRRLAIRHSKGCPPTRVVELGGGDGTFLLKVTRRLSAIWPKVEAVLVDRQSIVTEPTREAFRVFGWQLDVVEADALDYLRQKPRADVVMANLFLHHFDDVRLALLLAAIADAAPLFLACEPRRSALALAGSRMLWGIGCNDVSRHDATVSVKAGFNGDELSSLWPQGGGWTLAEHSAGLFSHAFVARRLDENAI